MTKMIRRPLNRFCGFVDGKPNVYAGFFIERLCEHIIYVECHTDPNLPNHVEVVNLDEVEHLDGVEPHD